MNRLLLFVAVAVCSSEVFSQDACETDDGLLGKCVQPNACQKEKDPIDLSQLDVYRAANECHYLYICCAEEDIIIPVTQPPPKSLNFRCGTPKIGAYKLRSKADYTEFGEFPWMVAVMQKSNANTWVQRNYIGGGSLIHEKVVVTTAHRIHNYKKTELTCRAGEYDTQTTNEIIPHQDRDVLRIIIHEKFDIRDSSYNIALLIVDTNFDLNGENIGIACLGRKLPIVGTQCLSMGWGQLKFNNPDSYAVILKKVNVPLVSRQSCLNSFKNTILSRFKIHKSLMCAGGKIGSDTCKGDGGSSLVCEISGNGEPVQYGVFGMVSLGIKCGSNIPAVYVNMPFFVNWIIEQFNDNFLEHKFFPED